MCYLQPGTGTKNRKFHSFPYLLTSPLNYSPLLLPSGGQSFLCPQACFSLAVQSMNFYGLFLPCEISSIACATSFHGIGSPHIWNFRNLTLWPLPAGQLKHHDNLHVSRGSGHFQWHNTKSRALLPDGLIFNSDSAAYKLWGVTHLMYSFFIHTMKMIIISGT